MSALTPTNRHRQRRRRAVDKAQAALDEAEAVHAVKSAAISKQSARRWERGRKPRTAAERRRNTSWKPHFVRHANKGTGSPRAKPPRLRSTRAAIAISRAFLRYRRTAKKTLGRSCVCAIHNQPALYGQSRRVVGSSTPFLLKGGAVTTRIANTMTPAQVSVEPICINGSAQSYPTWTKYRLGSIRTRPAL
jgi:hypothetical protein